MSLRCLLVAPAPGVDGESGDLQYTRDLLASPPAGVEYVTYPEAMASGELREAPSLRPGRSLPGSPRALASAAGRTILYAARAAGMLLPDPVRWWYVDGDFDLVHSHCFPIKMYGKVPPIVVTDSAGTFWYWTAARGYSESKTWRLLRRERRIAQAYGYVHPTVTPDLANRALYFIEAGRDLAAQVGIDPAVIDVAPAGVPDARTPSLLALEPPTLLFVARNFEVKGGPDTLRAFAAVRRKVPQARLLIAGPPEPLADVAGVTWLGSVSRDALYRDIYPRADLFVYPTHFDVAPLVVAEALAHGIPVVGNRSFGLPDLVVNGATGILVSPGDSAALADAVLRLFNDPPRLRALGAAAALDFRQRLSVSTRNAALAGAYAEVVRTSASSRRTQGVPSRPDAHDVV